MLDSRDVLIMMLLQMLKEVLVGGWDLGVREIMQYRNQGSIKKVVCWNCGKKEHYVNVVNSARQIKIGPHKSVSLRIKYVFFVEEDEANYLMMMRF
jgi:hypothetical protein